MRALSLRIRTFNATAILGAKMSEDLTIAAKIAIANTGDKYMGKNRVWPGQVKKEQEEKRQNESVDDDEDFESKSNDIGNAMDALTEVLCIEMLRMRKKCKQNNDKVNYERLEILGRTITLAFRARPIRVANPLDILPGESQDDYEKRIEREAK